MRRAIILIVLSTIGFAFSHVLIRYISTDVSPIQVAFFHNFFGLIILTPWLLKNGLGPLKTAHLSKHFFRALLNVSAMLAYFSALAMVPLAKVTALFFTSPIFAVILSMIILGERAGLRRWSAVVCGFVGVLVILRPGIEAIDLGSTLVLGASLLWAGAVILIKILGRTESSMTSTGYMSFFMMILSVPPALYVWQPIPAGIWPFLIIISILGTTSMLAITQALKEADASALMPYEFLKLIWVSIFGYVLFAQQLDIFIWIGGTIVFVSTFYLAYRENALARQELKNTKQ